MVLVIYSVRSGISDSSMPLENSKQTSIFSGNRRERNKSGMTALEPTGLRLYTKERHCDELRIQFHADAEMFDARFLSNSLYIYIHITYTYKYIWIRDVYSVTGNYHFKRYLRPLPYSLSVACRVGRQLTLYYPPELTDRQNQTLQKGKRKRKEAPDRDRQVSVPPVSLSVQVVERGVDSVTAIERVKNGNSGK